MLGKRLCVLVLLDVTEAFDDTDDVTEAFADAVTERVRAALRVRVLVRDVVLDLVAGDTVRVVVTAADGALDDDGSAVADDESDASGSPFTSTTAV